MTFHFLDDVFLLDLALKPAQCVFKRLAFLNANLCQRTTPPDVPDWALTEYRKREAFSSKDFAGKRTLLRLKARRTHSLALTQKHYWKGICLATTLPLLTFDWSEAYL